jgi:hypothetical protein
MSRAHIWTAGFVGCFVVPTVFHLIRLGDYEKPDWRQPDLLRAEYEHFENFILTVLMHGLLLSLLWAGALTVWSVCWLLGRWWRNRKVSHTWPTTTS